MKDELKIPPLFEVIRVEPGRPAETLGLCTNDRWKTLKTLVGGDLLIRPLDNGITAVLNMNKVFDQEEYSFTSGGLDYYGTVIFCKLTQSLSSLNGAERLEIKLRVRDAYIARWDKEMEAGLK